MKTMIHTLVKQVILLIIITQIGFASSITLKNILRSSDKHSTLSRSLAQDALAQEEKNLADTSLDPVELYGERTRARPELGGDGYEYAIGISKNIKLGNIQAQEQKMTRLSNEASALEARSSVISFRNGLKNLYHQYCLDVQNYATFRQSYDDIVKLYNKKQKAYKYQEIAKTELMQIQSEKRRTFAKLQEMKMMQSIKKNKVLMLSRVGISKKTKLSCRDMYPIRTTVKLGKTFKASKAAHAKRLESTKERMKRYSHAVESVNVSAQYGKELDMDKYTIGVSLPLNFTSNRSEHEKAAAMYRHSALSYGYEQSMREKKSMLQELKTQLKSYAIITKSMVSNYTNYKKSVLPLIKKSYDLGETSVIEYLLNRQKLYSLNQEVYASKKAYYQTLFTLYTLVEKKD
jgi:hypothetical protein